VGRWLDALDLLGNGRRESGTEGSTREAALRQYIGWGGGVDLLTTLAAPTHPPPPRTLVHPPPSALCPPSLHVEGDDELAELQEGLGLAEAEAVRFREAVRRLQTEPPQPQGQASTPAESPDPGVSSAGGAPALAVSVKVSEWVGVRAGHPSFVEPAPVPLTAGQRALQAAAAARQRSDEAADAGLRAMRERREAAERAGLEAAANAEAVRLAALDEQTQAYLQSLPVGLPRQYRWECPKCGQQEICGEGEEEALVQRAVEHLAAWAVHGVTKAERQGQPCATELQAWRTAMTCDESVAAAAASAESGEEEAGVHAGLHDRHDDATVVASFLAEEQERPGCLVDATSAVTAPAVRAVAVTAAEQGNASAEYQDIEADNHHHGTLRHA
jgi:hypothetical protein